jgi:phospholipase/carboxylesterase
MPTTTLLPAVEINPSKSVQATVIWLHGLGADGHDLAEIVPQLHLPPELGIRFVFPHAPTRTVTINGGLQMSAWFDIYGLNKNSPIDEVGIREAQEAIQQLIDREIASGVPSSKIVLAGFSQGGTVAIIAGLSYPQPLAGIMGLSTCLSPKTDLTQIIHPANRATRLFLAHGLQDPVLPVVLGADTRDVLIRAGYSITWRAYPMEHQICPAEIKEIVGWLKDRLDLE